MEAKKSLNGFARPYRWLRKREWTYGARFRWAARTPNCLTLFLTLSPFLHTRTISCRSLSDSLTFSVFSSGSFPSLSLSLAQLSISVSSSFLSSSISILTLFAEYYSQTDFGIPGLPANMCREDVLSAMCPEVSYCLLLDIRLTRKHVRISRDFELPLQCSFLQVRTVCDYFPEMVSKIVQFNGFRPEDFDGLYRKVGNDPVYRFRVSREMKKLEKMELLSATNQ